MTIQAWKLMEQANVIDENREEHIRETVKEPDEDLETIERLVEEYRDVLPRRAQPPKLVLPQERERFEKRNVLPDYDPNRETYHAEVIETTLDRFMTHEPCVEHEPAEFEKPVLDPREQLQSLLRDGEDDYTQYRNSETGSRFVG